MKLALLFPGQGSEQPRMGLELAARCGRAGELLRCAGRLAGADPERLLVRGGHDLARTEVMQPVFLAVCLGVLEALRAGGVAPPLVAGHSLGELAAWCAAGCVSPEDALAAAAVRGRLMAREAALHPGGLLALADCDEAGVERALARGRPHGVIALAAHNAPREWVLGGDEAALRAVAAAGSSVRLPVPGPWHAPSMAGAVEELRGALRALARRPPRAAFVCNRTGEVVPDAEVVPDLLAEQLVNPVAWAATMRTLNAAGVDRFVVVGPGKVLRGLVRKNLGAAARVLTTEDPADIEATLEALA